MPNKGFTLIELMVVISIIAILSMIGLTVFSGVQKSARDAKRRADLKAIATALEIYKIKTGTYPVGNTSSTVFSDSGQDPWIPGLDGNYMNNLPVDPTLTHAFAYEYYAVGNVNCVTHFDSGTYFILMAHLENPNSADLKTKCMMGTNTTDWNCSEGSTNSGPNTYHVPNAFFVCNQQ